MMISKVERGKRTTSEEEEDGRELQISAESLIFLLSLLFLSSALSKSPKFCFRNKREDIGGLEGK